MVKQLQVDGFKYFWFSKKHEYIVGWLTNLFLLKQRKLANFFSDGGDEGRFMTLKWCDVLPQWSTSSGRKVGSTSSLVIQRKRPAVWSGTCGCDRWSLRASPKWLQSQGTYGNSLIAYIIAIIHWWATQEISLQARMIIPDHCNPVSILLSEILSVSLAVH